MLRKFGLLIESAEHHADLIALQKRTLAQTYCWKRNYFHRNEPDMETQLTACAH